MLNLKNLFTIKRLPRWIFVGVLILIPILGSSATREAYFKSISDAYLQVSVFVALTLFIFYALETWFRIDTEQLLKKYKKFQIPISAFMGVLPGCGGAIMVMTQYTMGRLGFGSVIAVLSSTMGDAAFLLLAQRPDKAIQVFAISFFIGITFGYLVEKIHGYDFMRQKQVVSDKIISGFETYGLYKQPWILMLIPGLVFGGLIAFKADYLINANLIFWFGVVGGILSIILWFINLTAGSAKSNFFVCRNTGDIFDKLTSETAFVTTLVVVGYLVFELGVLWTGFDFASVFNSIYYFLPLIGVLVGFIPGCGPQIIVTSLYLQGLVPFSVQIGNAISNDGDALFPAIAMAPKASIVATLYTSIPALIASYAYMFLFEL